MYIPTGISDIDEIDAFYGPLHTIQKEFPKDDIAIVVGELNTKVGSDNNLLEHVMERHGLRGHSNNCVKFVDYSNFERLFDQ